jgi:hypothetical protein
MSVSVAQVLVYPFEGRLKGSYCDPKHLIRNLKSRQWAHKIIKQEIYSTMKFNAAILCAIYIASAAAASLPVKMKAEEMTYEGMEDEPYNDEDSADVGLFEEEEPVGFFNQGPHDEDEEPGDVGVFDEAALETPIKSRGSIRGAARSQYARSQVAACSTRPTLRLYSGYSSSSTLRRAVMDLQNILNTRNYAGLSVDGYFGTLTDRAVRNWQSKKGLAVDGIVGPNTWTSLCSPNPPSGGGSGVITVQRILETASREVGVVAYPEEDWHGRINDYRNAVAWVGEDREPELWCADFVSWVFETAGSPLQCLHGEGESSVSDMKKWIQNSGRWRTSPQAGDIIFYTWSHVGIVKSVLSNGRVKAIDGNTSNPYGGPNGVFEKTRSPSEIAGYGRVI